MDIFDDHNDIKSCVHVNSLIFIIYVLIVLLYLSAETMQEPLHDIVWFCHHPLDKSS